MSDDHPLAPFIDDETTARALAEAVGCSVPHLRNIRDGRKGTSMRLAKRLSDATKLPMETFLQPEAAAQ